MYKTLYFDDSKLPSPTVIDFKDKSAILQYLISNLLLKTQSMFEWKGLPTTIPQTALEMTVQRAGHSAIFEWEGKLYQCSGNIYDRLNPNYLPSAIIVSNPYIKNFTSKSFRIYYGKDNFEPIEELNTDGDCVIIQNDALYMGLMPIFNFHCSQFTENVLTKRILTINMRAMNVFIAPDQKVKDNIDNFLTKLENGEVNAISAKNLLKDVESLPYAESKAHGSLTDLIEDQQYIKASLYNDIGLNANYNMKRESINSNESQLNEDALLPLCDHMLMVRQRQCKLVNEKFGTDWSVDFSSAWKEKREEIEEELDAIDETSNIVEDEKIDLSEEVQQAGKEGEGDE